MLYSVWITRPNAISVLMLVVLILFIGPVDSTPEEPTREVPASEILEKIQRGEDVAYDHVIIKGDLDLSLLELPTWHVNRTRWDLAVAQLAEKLKVVISQIKITNSRIDGNLKLNDTVFQKSIEFSGINISGIADFRGSTFSGDADFDESKFGGDAYFARSQFSGYAYFRGSWFSGYTDFRGSTFSGDA